MKKLLAMVFLTGCSFFFTTPAWGAFQYNWSDNEGWFTFDGSTEMSFDAELQNPENYIAYAAVSDYGWYGLDQQGEYNGTLGSFKDGATATFNENDKIGLWVKDAFGTTFTSTRKGIPGLFTFAGKEDRASGGYTVYVADVLSGDYRSYVFSGTSTSTGQPLPGILATLLAGGAVLWYTKKHKNKLAKQ